jgi:hypothetical protein
MKQDNPTKRHKKSRPAKSKVLSNPRVIQIIAKLTAIYWLRYKSDDPVPGRKNDKPSNT